MTTPTPQSISLTRPTDSTPLRLSTISAPPTTSPARGTVLLIHNFPLTSHQFYHVTPLLTAQGYHLLIPDHTGAGLSSRPLSNFTKSALASDLLALIDALSPPEPLYLVAHDIGGMIGAAFCLQYPARVRAAVLGECPLPSTSADDFARRDEGHFHFPFQSHVDLAVALVTGKGEMYLRYFFDRQAHQRGRITDEDIAVFTKACSQSGALRAAFMTYQALGRDREEFKAWREWGKGSTEVLALCGGESHWGKEPGRLLEEVFERVEEGKVRGAGHYVALEEPEGFVQMGVGFLRRYE
ncbi:Alpha/Beta hydrolase protein [Elsinoe ampelina]|uniref:Alpha/Beta hydrolase protein n=1 Tax=Elsinoe ampelina TaxID=302913 RepID=A0A6A6GEQ8_9PEZI|nr:Alpha/Beta hydrolase protein [Elsinoe ampelina]